MISYREYRQGRAVVRTLFVLWALVLIAAAATIFLPFTAHAQDSGFYARITYTASGGTTFTIPFPYIASTDINVYDNGALKVSGTDYTFPDVSHVQFTSAPTTGHTIQIYRWTSIVNSEATFHGGPIASIDLNRNDLQKLYGLQEAHDRQGSVTNITAGTGLTLTPNPITVTGTISLNPASGSIGGVVASSAGSHQYTTGVTSGSGAITYAQPSVADLSEGSSGTGAVARVGGPTFTGTLIANAITATSLSAPNFTNSVAGLVPTGGTNTTYLRGDGTWNSPSGNGTVTSVTCGTNLTGGTFTASGTCAVAASLTGMNTITAGRYNLDSANGVASAYFFQTGGVSRWLLSKATTESGSNTGSDLFLARVNDAGSNIDNPITIPRNTGIVGFADGWQITGSSMKYTPGTTAVAGSIMGSDMQLGDGVENLTALGGIFPGNSAYMAASMSRTFGAGVSSGGVPAATLGSFVSNTGSGGTTMPFFGFCRNESSGGACQGMNLIIGDDTVHRISNLTGVEVDMELTNGMSATGSSSNGVQVVGFNTTYGNAFAVTNGAGATSFQNGLCLCATFTGAQINGNSFNVDTSGVFNHTSDMRLKNVILPVWHAVDDLSKIRTFYYTCKDPRCGLMDGTRYIGLAAQDVQKVYPELVHTANDTDGTLSVNYAGMVPALIEAVRELRADNEALRLELNTFKRGVHGGRRFATKH